MSMAPDPGKILDLLTLFDKDFQPRFSADSLLQQITPQLLHTWPLIELARAYVADGSGLRLVAATDNPESGPPAPEDAFAQALAVQRPVWDAARQFWCAPLQLGQTAGVLAVRFGSDAPEAESWLRLLAGLIGNSITERMEREESQRRSDQLQRVNQFGRTLQSTLNLESILETALSETHQIIPVERMMIALHDPASDSLRTAALYANGENYLTPLNGVPVQLQGSLAGHVWETQQLLHIPDIMRQQGLPAGDVRELRALLVTPLLGRVHALGVVSVGHGRANAYSETDVIVFQQMMSLLAAAIENASVIARSQRQVRNEALVNDIATRLQQQVELDDMLHIAVSDLGRVLGARRARIRLGTRETE
ncbi:MAG TPA: GAF domain-containing protein [Spirillospora sp.]|nr:GAF domain-containing protein [Spirillospora sp.]